MYMKLIRKYKSERKVMRETNVSDESEKKSPHKRRGVQAKRNALSLYPVACVRAPAPGVQARAKGQDP